MANQNSSKKLDRRFFSRIANNYTTLEEVTDALARAGLESSNLIVGIDFTASNEWTGKRSYEGRSLHHTGNNGLNPYEQAISIIGETLAKFDEDNLIPCYGFGDASTRDQEIFSFYPNERYCNGFEEVLRRYKEIVPHLRLAGPTSFAPIIEKAMSVVQQSKGQYHVLVIIADGQVTRSIDTANGQLSKQEEETVGAIVQASQFPLSIILVGVGDGPWDMMREFDDNIPARDFDNFQFVNFTEIMLKDKPQSQKETEFALSALMEIPSQYKAAVEFGLLGVSNGNFPERYAIPPPVYDTDSASTSEGSSYNSEYNTNLDDEILAHVMAASLEHSLSLRDESYASTPTTPSAPISTYDPHACPICLDSPKNMAFGCGHQTCCECGQELETCPICRSEIDTRIKLY